MRRGLELGTAMIFKVDGSLATTQTTGNSSDPHVKNSRTDRTFRRVILSSIGIPLTHGPAQDPLWFFQTLRGCLQCHREALRRGILHRDVSAGNLIAAPKGSGRLPFLTDFDVALNLESPAPCSGPLRTGTPLFMAVEILQSDVPHAAKHDVESFFWIVFYVGLSYGARGYEHSQLAWRWTTDLVSLSEMKYSARSRSYVDDPPPHLKFNELYQPFTQSIDRLRALVHTPPPDIDDLYDRFDHLLGELQMEAGGLTH